MKLFTLSLLALLGLSQLVFIYYLSGKKGQSRLLWFGLAIIPFSYLFLLFMDTKYISCNKCSTKNLGNKKICEACGELIEVDTNAIIDEQSIIKEKEIDNIASDLAKEFNTRDSAKAES